MRIEPGRLVEAPCAHCGHLEHRAFGESVSHRGELASYAIGWTSGHDDVTGRMTVGIGVGNPGGASFHIELFAAEGETKLRLVDEPFEAVPQGGPDLTRDEALAHDTLDYIWWVADEVLRQDRRAWWMEHYLHGTRAFVTEPVAHGAEPVVYVVRDDDGDWQLMCGTVQAETPQVIHLHHALDRDRTLLDVLDLPPGERADRDAHDRPWVRARL